MPKTKSEYRLERFNVNLMVEDSEWMNHLSAEIFARSGKKVTRSEIIRSALATLQELHQLAPRRPDRFTALEDCTSERQLTQMGILAIRWATLSG